MRPIPIKSLLRSTDGQVIDLLNPMGFTITEWVPRTTALKGDGVRVESRVLDSDVLVGGAYGNVAEELTVVVNENELAERIRELEALLVDAANWALQSWQNQRVYWEVQWEEEDHARYAQVVMGSFRFGSNVFGYHSGLPDNTLTIERGPFWHGAPPGSLLGPFTNWITNPSFEYWYHGFATAGAYPRPIPAGWYESVESGIRPADAYIRREDAIVAGPYHALEIGFTTATTGDWRLQTWIVIPDPHYVLTLRFWLYLRGDLTNHTFSVFLADTTGGIYHEETFNAEATGWQHFTFSIAPDDPEFIFGIRWLLNAAGSSAYAIVDRMILMDSEMEEADWPDVGFYLTCTSVWNWEDQLSFWCEKTEPDHPCHHLNYFDVLGVPGNTDALMRLSLSRLGTPYGDEDKDLNQLLVAQRRRLAMERSLNVDPDGYTGSAAFVGGASSESMVTSPITGGEDYRDVCFKHVDGAYEADRFAGRYRVFARLRWTSAEQEPSIPTEVRLTYWVGSPEQTIALDPIEIADGSYFRMVNLTSKAIMDWLPTGPTDPPNFFGLIVQARNYTDGVYPDGEDGEIEVDFLLLAALDNGLMWVTFPDEAPMLPSQAMVLDSTSRGVQVSQSTPAGTWVWDSTLTRIADLAVVGYLAAAPYMGGLYLGWSTVGGVEYVARYDNSGWTDTGFPLAAGSSVRNFITFDDRLLLSRGLNLYSYHPTDGWVLEAVVPAGTSVEAIGSFGGWLWVVTDTGNVYRWDGRAALALSVNVGAGGTYRTVGYQGRLWLAVGGPVNTMNVYEYLTGWRLYTSPGATYDMAVFNNRLYVLITTIGDIKVTNGDGNWRTVHTIPTPGNGMLCVYDGYLYAMYTTLGRIRTFRSPDGEQWEMIYDYDGTAFPTARTVYGGRLFFAHPLDKTTPSSITWHQNSLVLGGTPPHTGRAMTLRHTEVNRQYVMMEIWEPQEEGDPLPSCDVSPCTGPRLFCHVWFDPRWLSARGDI